MKIVSSRQAKRHGMPRALVALSLALPFVFLSTSLYSLEITPAFVGLTSPVLEEPFAAVPADFNEDGHADLAVGNDLWGEGYVTILLGDGRGSFPLQAHFPIFECHVRDIAVDDFNGDGHWDVCAVQQLAEQITVLFGNGIGHLTRGGVYGTHTLPEYVTSRDLNDDGFPDLALSHWVSGEISVMLNNGEGGFEIEDIYDVGGGPKEIDTGDFNEDGRVDLAVATMAFNEVYVLYGDGTGSFGNEEQIYVDYDAYVVKTDDFNGDGHEDIAVGTKHSFLLYLGDGEGNFSRSFETTVFDPHAIKTGDFNEDGLLDAGLAMTLGNLFEVYIGDGNGGFRSETVRFDLPSGPRSLGKADFNEDGHPDLVSANESSNNLTALMNQVNLLGVATEPSQRFYSSGREATFLFRVENPQDSLVNAHMWFTLDEGGEETFIDPALLGCGENPMDISLSPGSQNEYSISFRIPEEFEAGLYRFYVNTGDCGWDPDELRLSEGEGGAGTPRRLMPTVLSSGKIPFRVIAGKGEGEEDWEEDSP